MVDPRKTRLSKHFLLSDFMACHSVYARGLPNVWDDPDGTKLAEAKNLARNVMEPIIERYGPVSISYGYISPELSREIVTYQDPNKPSYHRYDDGAAVDFVAHRWVQQAKTNLSAPITLAHRIDREGPGYSRLITYSESPYICIASKVKEYESGKHRFAFYENRYMGKPKQKPLFITMSKDMVRRREQRISALQYGWRGAGYPTYHGGGRRQIHHIRTSKYTMLSDWLFSIDCVTHGVRNHPTPSEDVLRKFQYVGALYDDIIEELGIARMSIVQGWAGPHLRLKSYNDFHWTDKRFAFVVALPKGTDEDAFVETLKEQDDIDTVEEHGKGQWLIVGCFE